MSFHIKILLLSFFTSIVIAFVVIPILRKLKAGQSEREDGPQSHLGKSGTPTMGGIIMIISTLILSAFRLCKRPIRNSNKTTPNDICNIGIWSHRIYR